MNRIYEDYEDTGVICVGVGLHQYELSKGSTINITQVTRFTL